ncbi:hypothetical protein AKO1_015019 [Acrasis kona]|uniref:PrcB C-terminal domain-containing protein n=1 Tax=Acrasis kona TaxID=1008807 RepID=A0AAW2YRP5_9EUKA
MSSTEVPFEVVQQGIYGRHPPTLKKAMLIEEKECVSSGIKSDVIESTNFENKILIYVASGQKPTGGYTVQVKKIKVDVEGAKIEVYAKDVEPKDSFGTMALTQPFCVVRVDKPSFELKKEYKIHWMKKKTQEIKE